MSPYIVSYSQAVGMGRLSFVYFVVHTAVLLVSRPAMGRVLDAKGRDTAMYPAFALLAMGLLSLAVFPCAAGIVLAAALLGVGYGSVFSGAQVIAVRACGERRVGFATSTYFALADFGTGVGSAVMGVVFGVWGFEGIYIAAGAGALLLVPMYALVSRSMGSDKGAGYPD